MVKEVEDRHT
jgi:chromosome segregation protein